MNGKRLKNRPVNTNNFSLNLYKYPFDAIAKNGLIEKYKMNPENWDETIDKRMEDFWDMLPTAVPFNSRIEGLKKEHVAYLRAGNTPISCSNGLNGIPSSNLISRSAIPARSAANGAKW